MQVFFLLSLQILSIRADIDRRDGATNIFDVLNHGRMYWSNVIMFLEEISLHECANYCIMHLQCQSVSYSSTAKLCELNDIEFDEFEGDTNAIGWMNYGTPPKVDGGFSDWTNVTGCSRSCDVGHMTYIRSCDNPKPQQGGANCVGEEIKTEPCFIRHCPVDGGFSDWTNVTGCSRSCDVGHMTYIRSCDNPKPQQGGANCVGEEIKREPCFIRHCPVSACYGARGESYGEMKAPISGYVKSIQLKHISGGLNCVKDMAASRWGCSWTIVYGNGAPPFMTFITDGNRKVIFPSQKTSYFLPGSDIEDDKIVLSRASPYSVKEGQILRIWFGEDLNNAKEWDNSGKHCITAELIYEL